MRNFLFFSVLLSLFSCSGGDEPMLYNANSFKTKQDGPKTKHRKALCVANNNRVAKYSGGCTIGSGWCLPPKPKAFFDSDVEINSLTAYEVVNTIDSLVMMVDLISSTQARLWISNDLSYVGLSSNDFATIDICETDLQFVKLKAGVYKRVVNGNYFTYVIPYVE